MRDFSSSGRRGVARFAHAALILLVLCAAGIACSRRDESQSSDESDARARNANEELLVASGIETGKRGGAIIVGGAAGAQTFNPLIASDAGSTEVIHRIFDGLVELDCATGEYRPALATRWEISPDGRRWTFFLRRGVRWADGQPFTADDVLWNFEVVADESLGAISRESFMLDGEPFRVSKAEAGGDAIIIETPRPYGALLSSLATELPLLPKHVWDEAYRSGQIAESIGIDAAPDRVFGTGPYKLAVAEAGRVVLERNTNYWKADASGARLPYIHDLMFLNAGNQNAWRLKFEASEVDNYLLRADEIASFKDTEGAGDFKLYDLGPRSGTTHLWFNQNPGRDEKGRPFVDPAKLALFQDLRFRQAVAHAIDRDAIVRTCYNGFGTVVDGPVSPSMRFWFNDHLPRYEHDVTRAKALLSELGLRDGDGDGFVETPSKERVEFTIVTNSESPVRVAIGRLVVDDLRAVGLDAHLETVEIGALIARVQQTFRYEACLLALSGGVDPAVGISVWHSSGEMHQFHPSQAEPATAWEREADSLLSASVATVALDERKRLFDRVQELYAINLGWIFLANDNTFLAVRNRFGNVRPGTLRAMNEFCWNEDELFVK